jgi:predicted transcriptional regulator
LNQVILFEKNIDLLEEIHKEGINSNEVVEVARKTSRKNKAKAI